jgi:hypothetical protein
VGALLELLDEAALARAVSGFPAMGALEPTQLIKRCIEGVFVLSAPLTAAGSPRASLVSRHSFQASGALGERLLEVEPHVDMESRLAVMGVSRLANLSS